MDELEAKRKVVEAGKRLVAAGLIARTWGNVSCRLDEEYFVITPSGRSYESLTPGQIVRVRAQDLSWQGDIKPSSEKGAHATVYAHRPDVGFVIHTHQTMASSLSCLGRGFAVSDNRSAGLLGGFVPAASYALPGTKALVRNIGAALLAREAGAASGLACEREVDDAKRDASHFRNAARALLMSRHGALCFGRDAEEAFRAAEGLELAAQDFIVARAKELGCADCSGFAQAADFVMRSRMSRARISIVPRLIPEGLELCDLSGRPLARVLREGRFFFLADNDFMRGVSNSIFHLRPLLDDFAQIIGLDMRNLDLPCAEGRERAAALHLAREIRKALRRRSGVLVRGFGAVCVGDDEGEARSAAIVAEKNCVAWLVALLFDRPRPINICESLLMNQVFKRRYSKLARVKT